LAYNDSIRENPIMLAPADQFEDRPFALPRMPGSEAFPLWRRMLNKWLLGAEGRPLGDGAFPVSVRLRVLPDIRFGWGTVGASTYNRTRDVVAKDNDDLFLFMNLGGSLVANDARQEIELAPGDAFVMGCHELGSHSNPTDGNVLCLRVHREAMQPLVRGLDDKLGAVIHRDNEGLQLLSTYLRSVGGSERLASDSAKRLTTRHVHDLLALTLGAGNDAREILQERGLRAGRLRAAKVLIERNLTEPGLTAEFVAARLRLSPRSVQRLFESEGTTFSNFVTGERIARAYETLADPRECGRSIADIALDCGFGDISYFNKRFRSRYDASPSDVRHREPD
jgi:AraC-like DNA-binding protein